MKTLIAILFSIMPILSMGQLAIGQWRTYLSYGSASAVEQANDKIFGVYDGALVSISKEDGEVNTFSSINGMSDLGVDKIKHCETLNTLVVTYANGNIDLISGAGIKNISDIKNKAITADKRTNDILISDNKAYISNGFGVVLLNLSKKEIADTYIFTNEQANTGTFVGAQACAIFNDSIYIISKTDIYAGFKNSAFLANYQNWIKKSNLPEPGTENKMLVAFNNKMYLLKASGNVYSSDDSNNWTIFNNSKVFNHIRVTDNNLLLYTKTDIVKYNQNNDEISLTTNSCNDVVYNQSDASYWVATDSMGIIKVHNNQIVNEYKFDGPVTNKIFRISFQGEKLYGYTVYKWYTEENSPSGALMIYDGSSWINFTKKEINPLTNTNFTGINHVAVDRNDPNHYFVSSWREGIYEFQNNVFVKRYNYLNSTIENFSTVNEEQTVHGVCFDKNNNLWFNQEFAKNCIKVRTNTGEWLQYRYSALTGNSNGFDRIFVASNNYKWMNNPRSSQNGGVFILNDKNNPNDSINHQSIYFSTVTDQDEESVSINPTYCIAEDTEGDIWVGTNNGPVIFKNVENIFKTGYKAYRIKISRNDGTDYADYLLGEQKINDIAVDAGNRKWIATETAGVYLMSADGQKTIQHFTTENSPLFSNTVLSLAINNKTGEVFIATNLGLMSYQSDASESRTSYENINVYPNPVRESYTGLISFSGLMKNSIVKITDGSGHLVYQAKSNGGLMTWDGKSLDGNKVSTGVYFVMCSNANEDNTENISTGIGKFLIIK